MKERPRRTAGRTVKRMFVAFVLLMGGCAGPGADLFPITSVEAHVRADGTNEQWYDLDGNGRPNFCEIASEDGRVVAIGYDHDGDSRVDEKIVLADVPPEEHHHLVIILDSVPPMMVREMQAQGRLRYFPPASRVVAPFPVMTDVCLTEFFGRAPVPGVESSFYDGQRLHSGLGTYVREENVPWVAGTDYHLDPSMHAYAYLWQHAWYLRDLRCIQEVFAERDRAGQKLTVAYVVGTSALGARQGRNGHAKGLVALDRFCQEMVYRTRGRVRISLFSDHGHGLQECQRVPLLRLLRQLGYQPVTGPLREPDEVVVPEFGMVSCAAVHTLQPARVAGDVVALEGVELACYRQEHAEPEGSAGREVVVVSRTGRARIDRGPAGLRYRADVGDPLKLAPILAELAMHGKIDDEGFVADDVLFEATIDHVYPDAVHRLWRAFDGLIVHEPDVLISIAEGYEVGGPLMSRIVSLASVHGNLRPLSSFGFATSMAGKLPDTVRMDELRAAFQSIGVPIPDPPPADPSQ